MIDMSTCVRCKNTIIGDTKIHLEQCEKMERLNEALEYYREEGTETLTLEQVENLVDFLVNTPLSGDLIARCVIGEFNEF